MSEITNLKFNILSDGKRTGKPLIANMDINRTICLIDTGANLPVWCSSEQGLIQYYNKAVPLTGVSILRGFGKEYEVCKVYKIPDFVLTDGKSKIHYIDLPIAVVDRDYNFEVILSYTMLSHINFSLNNFVVHDDIHKVSPYIQMSSYKNRVNVGCIYKNINEFANPQNIHNKIQSDKIIDSIYVFTS
jgi:hypothetical protein